jgi:phosphoribosylanthranilate isomerase
MKLKVCGMCEVENLQELSALNLDYIGFIFYAGSPRFVSDEQMKILAKVPLRAKKTGVFVDEESAVIMAKVSEYGLQAIQLHGNESISQCSALLKEGVEVIKAFGIDAAFDFSLLESYLDVVDYFLFDTKTGSRGGSGNVFDWEILKRYPYDKPYFLSGGLSLKNLSEVKRIKDERLFALDLNSRFEVRPGVKNVKNIVEAIKIVGI